MYAARGRGHTELVLFVYAASQVIHYKVSHVKSSVAGGRLDAIAWWLSLVLGSLFRVGSLGEVVLEFPSRALSLMLQLPPPPLLPLVAGLFESVSCCRPAHIAVLRVSSCRVLSSAAETCASMASSCSSRLFTSPVQGCRVRCITNIKTDIKPT